MCEVNDLPHAAIHGSVAVNQRQTLINEFNEDDSNLFCLIMTSRVGGIGLNIHGASRAVIFEPDWNPGQDEQAAARIHRPEQTENVAIYRLITSQTVEEWIYQRQVYKHNVAQHVLSEKHNDQRLFSKSSLSSLLFGKADTVSIVKDSGLEEVTIEQLNKSKRKFAEEEREYQIEQNIPHSLKNPEVPDAPSKSSTEVDGVIIKGVEKIKKVKKDKPKSDFEKSEDWVLQRLFKKAGAVIESAIDQRVLKDGSQDYKKIDEEARRVAKAAVANLHKLSKPNARLEGKIKKSEKSISALEQIRARRSVDAEIMNPLSATEHIFKKTKLNPNYKLARELRNRV